MELRVNYGERTTVMRLLREKERGVLRLLVNRSKHPDRKVDAEDFDYVFAKAVKIADKSTAVNDCGRAATTLNLVEKGKRRTTRACLRANTESSAATRQLIDLIATYMRG